MSETMVFHTYHLLLILHDHTRSHSESCHILPPDCLPQLDHKSMKLIYSKWHALTHILIMSMTFMELTLFGTNVKNVSSSVVRDNPMRLLVLESILVKHW